MRTLAAALALWTMAMSATAFVPPTPFRQQHADRGTPKMLAGMDSAVLFAAQGLKGLEAASLAVAVPVLTNAGGKVMERRAREEAARGRLQASEAARVRAEQARQAAREQAEKERMEEREAIEARIRAAQEEEERQERVKQLVLEAQLRKEEEKAATAAAATDA